MHTKENNQSLFVSNCISFNCKRPIANIFDKKYGSNLFIQANFQPTIKSSVQKECVSNGPTVIMVLFGPGKKSKLAKAQLVWRHFNCFSISEQSVFVQPVVCTWSE